MASQSTNLKLNTVLCEIRIMWGKKNLFNLLNLFLDQVEGEKIVRIYKQKRYREDDGELKQLKVETTGSSPYPENRIPM